MNVDWDSLVEWENKNNCLVMWVVTTNCIKERMLETNTVLEVSDSRVFEHLYHNRRAWDMDIVKDQFKDGVIKTLTNNYGEKNVY